VQPSKLSRVSAAFGVVLAVFPAAAQSLVMSLPRQSQRATISQRVALTDINITYHRPLVEGRKIFGSIVPYGQVWRAGANENTAIEISDPVVVEGQVLPKGTYGLHMIPNADSWTIIFSKNATSWGSFTYDQKEDALRVTVKPSTGEMHEAMTFDFDQVKGDSAVLTLRWDKTAVPIHIAVDRETTLANIRSELRNTAQYTWEGWNDAAGWCLQNKTDLDEALRWANRSIENEDRFENEMTKSQILGALNRGTEAGVAQKQALDKANAVQLYSQGRQIHLQGHKTEAMEFYKMVVTRFPDHWIAHLAKSRLAVASGDYTGALKEIQTAVEGCPESNKAALRGLQKRIENKEDINA
jgi:hypothetical protein